MSEREGWAAPGTYHGFLRNDTASNTATVRTLIRPHGVRTDPMGWISIDHPCNKPLFRCRRFRPVLETELGENLPRTLEHIVWDIGQRRHGLLPIVYRIS